MIKKIAVNSSNLLFGLDWCCTRWAFVFVCWDYHADLHNSSNQVRITPLVLGSVPDLDYVTFFNQYFLFAFQTVLNCGKCTDNKQMKVVTVNNFSFLFLQITRSNVPFFYNFCLDSIGWGGTQGCEEIDMDTEASIGLTISIRYRMGVSFISGCCTIYLNR